MKLEHPETRDAIAAQFVLGTLHGKSRARATHLRMENAALDDDMSRWEHRLAGWSQRLKPVQPPQRCWESISTRIDQVEHPRPKFVWQQLAAMLLVVVALFTLLPFERSVSVQQVAVFQAEASTQWLIEVSDRLTVRPLSPPALNADQDHELWLLTENGPVSLGVLPNVESTTLPIPPELQENGRLKGDKLAVSVEPRGGSPTGSPTGPVIAVTALQKAGP